MMLKVKADCGRFARYQGLKHKLSKSGKPQMKYEWAMPSKHTFNILPIQKFLATYLDPAVCFVDPFAGFNSPAQVTNDLNSEAPTTHHLEAIDFAKELDYGISGVLVDPPYSPRQLAEVYQKANLKLGKKAGQNAFMLGQVMDTLAEKMIPGAVALSFGWNSVGFGKCRGFTKLEILIVSHGGRHNDTICVAEIKTDGLDIESYLDLVRSNDFSLVRNGELVSLGGS